MKLAFMSSVCPKMTLRELLAAGEQHGYQGIEFRPEWGHGHGIELGASTAQRKEIARILADSPLEACALSPGVKFAEPRTEQRDAQLDTFLKYVQLAAKVSIGRIRVFGDPLANDGGRAACYAYQAEYLARAAAEAGKAGVTIILETHMNFRAFDAGEILYRTGYPPALRINWHLEHCLGHGEDVDEAYRHVKGRVSHAHFSFPKEAAQMNPLRRQVQLLAAEGINGFFSVEIIDPENPQEVLAGHANGWKRLCRELGIKTAR